MITKSENPQFKIAGSEELQEFESSLGSFKLLRVGSIGRQVVPLVQVPIIMLFMIKVATVYSEYKENSYVPPTTIGVVAALALLTGVSLWLIISDFQGRAKVDETFNRVGVPLGSQLQEALKKDYRVEFANPTSVVRQLFSSEIWARGAYTKSVKLVDCEKGFTFDGNLKRDLNGVITIDSPYWSK